MSSGDRRHDLIEELVVADALGGLDEAGIRELDRELAAHGPDCEECRILIAEYREVAGRLAFAIDPLPLAAGAEDRLVQAALGTTPRSPVAEAIVQSGDWPSSVLPGRLDRAPGRARRWVAAAAVAAALAVVAGFAGYSLAPKGGGLRAVAFQAQGAQQLAVVYQPGGTHAVVVGSNIAPPPPGKVYELWYQPSPDAPMHRAGIFEPKDGKVVAQASVGESFVALAVSVEPDGGSPAPTTAPVFLVTL